VKDITWCGTESATLAGCAIGRRIVVKRHDAWVMEQILWAHEIGHTRTLSQPIGFLGRHHASEILNDHFQLNGPECGLYSR
jgi:hypothetical protein